MFSSALFLALLAVSTPLARAQNQVDDDDVPDGCRSICQPLIDNSRNCYNQYYNNNNDLNVGDQNYRNCVCGNANAQQYISQCDACVRQDPKFYNNNINNNINNADDDVNQWLQACNLPSATYFGGIGPTLTSNYYNGQTVYPNNYNGGAYETVITSVDPNGFTQVYSTQIPANYGGGVGGYGQVTTVDQFGNTRVYQTSLYNGVGGIGGIGGVGQTQISYTTTRTTDQFGNTQTISTPVTFYASTSYSTTRTTDVYGNTQTYSVPIVSYTGAAKPVATAQAVGGAVAGIVLAALAL